MDNFTSAGPLIGAPAKMIAAGEWTSVVIDEITVGSARVTVDRRLELGAPVVICVAEVGALAGSVQSASDQSCLIALSTLKATPAVYRRAPIAAQAA